jgi:SM-20-related protein
MSVLDLAAFDSAALVHDPFDYLVVPGFLKPEAIEAVNRDFPELEGPANFAPEELMYGPSFAELLRELSQPEIADRFGQKFGVDLAASPTTITIRKYCELSDGDIHTDHWSKLITALIYFNPEWTHDGGRLRMLRSAGDIEDYGAEVAPLAGTLLVFRRSDRSFHGHKRFAGERRMLQMSWVRSSRMAQYIQKLDRFSTRVMKRVSRAF